MTENNDVRAKLHEINVKIEESEDMIRLYELFAPDKPEMIYGYQCRLESLLKERDGIHAIGVVFGCTLSIQEKYEIMRKAMTHNRELTQRIVETMDRIEQSEADKEEFVGKLLA